MELLVNLEDKQMTVAKEILLKIPVVENIIINNRNINNQINLEKFDYISFNNIIILIKHKMTHTAHESEQYTIHLIQNMNIDNLINFIYTTSKLELDYYNKIASEMFMHMFKNNSADWLKSKLNEDTKSDRLDSTKIFNIIIRNN